MKKSYVVPLIVIALFVSSCTNKKFERPVTYNFKRGYEAFQDEDMGEALDYFNKDIKENPQNGYSILMVAVIRLEKNDYGHALTAVEDALKYIPENDSDFQAFAFSTRGDIYLALEDTSKAVADYSRAIKAQPKESRVYEKRAQLYYELCRYDLSDADYRKMIELNPGDINGFMGIGRNANDQERWEDAIKQFDYVIKLDDDYSSAYAFRAESYLGLGKWEEAVDDIIKALEDEDEKAAFLVLTLENLALSIFEIRAKLKAAKEPNEQNWPFLLGYVSASNKNYDKAIMYLREANAIDVKPGIYFKIARCFAEKGDFRQAICEINHALDLDSTMASYLWQKARYLLETGDMDASIDGYNKLIETNPDDETAFYGRGWAKTLKGDLDGAIEDFSISIALDSKEPHSYVIRGDLFMMQGKAEQGEADYRKVIALEDSPDKYTFSQYAYHGLGMDEKALEIMNHIIERDTTEAENYYDAACLYGRIGDKDKALEYLGKALEKGFNRFVYMSLDFDMDQIRDTEGYKLLMEKYNNQIEWNENILVNMEESEAERITEVPFSKENGVCKIRCQINSLPLYFIFDTGASDVSLSMVEASFMMKNGYLSKSDVIGSKSYMDANGNVSVGTVINLKKVSFDDFELTNVRASVVRNQKAPLLLGQSVLGRLGKIEIDNQKRVIRITH